MMQEEKKDEKADLSRSNTASTSSKTSDDKKRIHSAFLSVLRMHGPTGSRLKDQFSSTPLDPETTSSFSDDNGRLTGSERAYLESLLKRGDPSLIERATQRLCDPVLFPPLDHCTRPSSMSVVETSPKSDPSAEADAAVAAIVSHNVRRRDSQIQQELFRLHETKGMPPSHLLKKINIIHMNSILDLGDDGGGGNDNLEFNDSFVNGLDKMNDSAQLMLGDEASESMDQWNAFKDVSGWLDGSQGVEVSDNGVPIPKDERIRFSRASLNQGPFLILGTAADDVSCHPHVLSPPLMESLLAFVPEVLSQHNFWLKYSLVRDGASLWTMLRQVRASEFTFLAIETEDGHVFGSFTCQAWRLAQGWYNSPADEAAFLWRMRRSRALDKPEVAQSILDQVNRESEIQVFPYRSGNVAVQYCSKDHLMLGQGEVLPTSGAGKHYGHGLYLDASLLHGTTSSCETFGNPCLASPDARGAKFQVSNLEVWTLTPHRNVHDAEHSELSQLFLLERGHTEPDNLNIMRILVGGPI